MNSHKKNKVDSHEKKMRFKQKYFMYLTTDKKNNRVVLII